MTTPKRCMIQFIQTHILPCSTYQTFPGVLPRALHRKDLVLLQNIDTTYQEIVVSLKADGERVLLLQIPTIADTYTLDRTFHLSNLAVHLFDSQGAYVFDCESIPRPGIYPLILIFDALMVNGVDVRKLSYIERLEAARWSLTQVHGPKTVHTRHPAAYPSTYQDIEVQAHVYMKVKQVFYQTKLPLLHYESLQWCYPNDGIIFTDCGAAYGETTPQDKVPTVCKWKPSDKVSIDVIIRHVKSSTRVSEIRDELKYGHFISTEDYDCFMYVIEFGQDCFFSTARKNTKIYPNMVHECMWDGYSWSVVKYRHDKKEPNSIRTIKHTLDQLIEGIDWQEIVHLYT
jgi:hypothetical protein